MAYVKYKAEQDRLIAEEVNRIIEVMPAISRFQIAKRVGVSRERLDRLARIGLITNYPRPMTRSQAGTHGRKVSGDAWGGKFKLRGSP